jgi:hypothetical protein
MTGEFDASANGGALFDGEPAGDNIAVEDGGLAQLDASGGMNISVDAAEDDKISDMELGGDACVGADGETGFGERDGAVEDAIEEEVFGSAELTTNGDRFSDKSGTFGWLHETGISDSECVK